MGNPLTPSQRQALTFIREFMAHHRFAPTAKEIADRFGIAEKNGFYYLDVLERKGYLRRGKHQPRRIELLGEPLPRSPVRVPVLVRRPPGSPPVRRERGKPPAGGAPPDEFETTISTALMRPSRGEDDPLDCAKSLGATA